MNEWPTSISKRILWRFVNQKIRRLVNSAHVFSVMTILFEEILKDLKRGKEIRLFNFGKLSLNPTKPRKYFDVRYQKVMQSKGHRILRFILAPALNKKLRQHLNIDKNIEDDHNE